MSDHLAMSDEEFLKQNPPDDNAQDQGQDDSVLGSQTEPEAPETQENQAAAEPPVAENETKEEPKVEEQTQEAETPKTEGETAVAEPVAAEPVKPGEGEQTADKAETPDYEGFYKQIMTPFKANGKIIELKDPKEAIQLMQMGANYTRKMQELAPQRKLLLMLENNGLLDEGKLSYLIDLEKKNPEAIKKLIKEAGIDLLEIDTAVEPAYREGNHRVSDEEANWKAALDEVKSNPAGTETLKLIHTGWDQASKEVLWKSPEILGIIHQQRETGIYDRIATEIDRRRTLGSISPEVPFLHAYKLVGDEMVAANAFDDLGNSSTSSAPPAQASAAPPAVVATRVAAPKPAVTNSDQAKAASPTRAAPAAAKTSINPLAMSDEEFMKQMDGRL